MAQRPPDFTSHDSPCEEKRNQGAAKTGRVLSHLSYEELKLVESLARLGLFAGQV
jgi:hypothetical protein